MELDWGTQRLINLHSAWRKRFIQILQRLGLRSVGELRGRTDLLMHLDYANPPSPALTEANHAGARK